MIAAPGITVNGNKITPEQINAEVQYHPAENLAAAKYKAMQALVIRELLVQAAVKRGLCAAAPENPDEIIERLLAEEIVIPEPAAAECARYYQNNKGRFHTAPLFEVSHILYAAPPEDEEERRRALEKAQAALARIQKDAAQFAAIARAESACSSGREGGRLGQIGKGQTMPAFEAALLAMKEGAISAAPVASEVGYHIIQVHKRAEGMVLPFETVANWISDFLKQESWRRAFSQYVQILAGQAEISGFHMKGADSPLVQ